MIVKIKKLHEDAVVPTYATMGSACFDIRAITSVGNVMICKDSSQVFNTGLAFEVPENHVMMVFSRSGHGFNSDVRLANCTGIIDSDYRGELLVKLRTDGNGFAVGNGDRIAQGMIIPVERVNFTEVDALVDTARGDGGIGSTGA